jgi:hypothetical protein
VNITEALKAEQKVNPHGVSVRPLFDSPHAVVTHITLGPGEALRRHTTPEVPVHAQVTVLPDHAAIRLGLSSECRRSGVGGGDVVTTHVLVMFPGSKCASG